MKTTRMLTIFVLALGLAAGVANADFTFGEPTNLGPKVNSPAHDGTPVMTADGLSIFFDSNRSGGHGSFDVWVVTRETTEDEWGTPVNLGSPVNTSAWDGVPSVSPDGLTLLLSSERPGGLGYSDIWMTSRETKDSPWAVPVNLGPPVSSPGDEWTQSISSDGLELYFSSSWPGGAGGFDLWVTKRATSKDEWGTPMNLGPRINSASDDVNPSIVADSLCLFFFSVRPGGYGNRDIWVTTRATRDDDWRIPLNLGTPLNSPNMDQGAIFSPDGATLYFCSNRPGGSGNLDLWQVPIEPIGDFNNDGIVDAADVCIMVEHWLTDYPLCDIGPMPWGDGIVDVQDLIILAEHLFEEIPPVE